MAPRLGVLRTIKTCVSVFAAIGAAAGTINGAAAHYHLLKKISVVPGDGIFDYVTVDSVNRRVYCSHGDELVVLDADSGSVVGRIPVPKGDPLNGLGEGGRPTPFMGVHHVAIAPELNRGFTANGRSATSTIFNLKTLEPIGEVKLTGRDPNAIVYDAPTGRVFAFNEASGDATVIDAREGTVVGTIALDGHPAFAASDGQGYMYVNLIDRQSVLQIDARTLSPGARWPIAACAGPYNETMAIDRVHRRLFVGCRPDFRQMLAPPGARPNRVMAILEIGTGRVVTTVPIGGNPDQADFDPGTGLVFSANGEGSVTVIQQESADVYRVLETVPTEPGAARLAVDPVTHRLFVPNADFGTAPPATPDNPNPFPATPPRNFRILVLEM